MAILDQTDSIPCYECRFRKSCVSCGLDEKELRRLNKIIKRGNPLQKGERLFSEGDRFSSLYVVHSGTIKTFTISEDGDENISKIHFAGDVIGFDVIFDEAHSAFAEAIETSMVCELPYKTVEWMMNDTPMLRRQLTAMMSRELMTMRQRRHLIATKGATGRIAHILCELSRRNAKRGLSPTDSRIPVRLADFGNFLGLTKETTSREISGLRDMGVISKSGRFFSILNLDKLRRISTFK